MIAKLRWLAVLAVLAVPCSAVADSLENTHVQVSIDPEHGGAVLRMIHKQAVVLPLVADRGATVAGQGRFFLPTLAVADRTLDLFHVPMQTLGEPSPGELRLKAELPQLSPGLRLERCFQTGGQESGVRITDVLANDGPDAREVRLRIGATSRFDGGPWNLSLRCWFGDRQTSRWMFTPYCEGTVSQLKSNTAAPFWRVIGQYGTGFLYRPVAPAGPVDLVHRLPKEPGHPAEFDWLSPPVGLADTFMIMATRAEPGGMCQHVFDNVGTLDSTCSSIAVLQTGDLYVSHGPSSQVEYVRYPLTDK